MEGDEGGQEGEGDDVVFPGAYGDYVGGEMDAWGDDFGDTYWGVRVMLVCLLIPFIFECFRRCGSRA